MFKLVAKKYATTILLVSLTVALTFACSSQDDTQSEDFQSLRTLDEVRVERSAQIQIQEDPPASNGFLQAGPSHQEIQLASDRFYSDKASQIDSSYREAKRQIEQRQFNCYSRLMSSNVADQSISTICNFWEQRQELENLVNNDYNSLWNQVRTFENEVSRLDWGSDSFNVQFRLEDELSRIGGMSFIDPYGYENEIQQDQWSKEDAIYRAESECAPGGSRNLFSGGSIECENNDPYGINNSNDSGFGLDDQDCQSWDVNCQQSDSFGDRADPWGQQSDSFGDRADPWGQQSDSFGDRADPWGQ
jgi:hypothetical protein